MKQHTCKQCGGTLGHLGSLGFLSWFRCVNCGWETSFKRKPRTSKSKKVVAK